MTYKDVLYNRLELPSISILCFTFYVRTSETKYHSNFKGMNKKIKCHDEHCLFLHSNNKHFLNGFLIFL